LVCVWQPNFEPVVCVCVCVCVCMCVYSTKVLGNASSQHVEPYTHTTGSKLRCQTQTKHKTNISEPLRVISVKYSSILPDDGSYTIRNMLE